MKEFSVEWTKNVVNDLAYDFGVSKAEIRKKFHRDGEWYVTTDIKIIEKLGRSC